MNTMRKLSLKTTLKTSLKTTMKTTLARTAAVLGVTACVASSSSAAFVGYVVTSTNVAIGGQNLVRYEVFAVFDGPTDTVLNVFNFQAKGGWGAHLDAAGGFWHKDNSDYNGGVLQQTHGTWAPSLTGSATTNRPFDSHVLIGGNPTASNTTNADPSWNMAGGWNQAQIPTTDLLNANAIGWFNSSPPNNQGRVGIAPNTATQVKLGQFILSQDDTAFRAYTLRTAYNNGAGGSVVFADGVFTLCVGASLYFRDVDGDGFGASGSSSISACNVPSGYVTNNLDCNDNNAAINPNTTWYRDIDGDGFGAAADGTTTQCLQPKGFVNNDDDCDIDWPSSDLDGNGIPDECEGEFVVGGSGFATLQAAVTAAPDGATIRVGAGTYTGATIVTGKRIHLESISGANVTIFSGAGLSSAILTFSSPEAAGSTVRGITFRDGRVGSSVDGLRVGGAIAALQVPVTIEDCVFVDNAAEYGGAVHFWSTGGTVRNCSFSGNAASLRGGGLAWSNPDATLALVEGCTFEFNEASIGGGIAQIQGVEPVDLFDSRLCGNAPENLDGPIADLGSNEFGDDCNGDGVCDIEQLNSLGADINGNRVLDECELRRGDLNLDGIIGAADLMFLLTQYGSTAPETGDLNLDGLVDAVDLSILLANWGLGSGGQPPMSITSVTPAEGPIAGGTPIMISGTNLGGVTSVSIGGVAATAVVVVSPNQVMAVTPPNSDGLKSLVVSSASSAVTKVDGFRYTAWYTTLEQSPDPTVVVDAAIRSAIVATGHPWRVRDNRTNIEMVLIPPGTFVMGCSTSVQFGCESEETPNHYVTISSAFYIGRAEVTQAEWVALLETNPSLFQSSPDSPSRPVERVSWDMARTFVDAAGLRLPTEAEWEYAYRAGTATAYHGFVGNLDGTSNGLLLGSIAWSDANSFDFSLGMRSSKPVRQLYANGFGLYDMSGNVWEWVEDWYGVYTIGAQTDPTGPAVGDFRVLRGGSWSSDMRFHRSSQRLDFVPSYRDSTIGFRVARNVY